MYLRYLYSSKCSQRKNKPTGLIISGYWMYRFSRRLGYDNLEIWHQWRISCKSNGNNPKKITRIRTNKIAYNYRHRTGSLMFISLLQKRININYKLNGNLDKFVHVVSRFTKPESINNQMILRFWVKNLVVKPNGDFSFEYVPVLKYVAKKK